MGAGRASFLLYVFDAFPIGTLSTLAEQTEQHIAEGRAEQKGMEPKAFLAAVGSGQQCHSATLRSFWWPSLGSLRRKSLVQQQVYILHEHEQTALLVLLI